MASCLDDACVDIGEAINRLDFIYESMAVKNGATEAFTPAGLLGLASILAETGDKLRGVLAQLEQVATPDLLEGHNGLMIDVSPRASLAAQR